MSLNLCLSHDTNCPSCGTEVNPLENPTSCSNCKLQINWEQPNPKYCLYCAASAPAVTRPPVKVSKGDNLQDSTFKGLLYLFQQYTSIHELRMTPDPPTFGKVITWLDTEPLIHSLWHLSLTADNEGVKEAAVDLMGQLILSRFSKKWGEKLAISIKGNRTAIVQLSDEDVKLLLKTAKQKFEEYKEKKEHDHSYR